MGPGKEEDTIPRYVKLESVMSCTEYGQSWHSNLPYIRPRKTPSGRFSGLHDCRNVMRFTGHF